MTNAQNPSIAELPSPASLKRATIIAIGVAALILGTIILPAEYGVDPTGVGRALGLKEMGEIKQQLAREAAAADAAEEQAAQAQPAPTDAAVPAGAAASGTVAAAASRSDTVLVSLAPNEGKEVKLVMLKGAVATYSWAATGGTVNYDMHGDSTGAPNSYISYKKGTGAETDSGTITAAMDGSHGWFWRNRSGRDVVVRLVVTGDYSELKKFF